MKNRKGFTLIEILAVIIILGIIAFIAVPSISKYLNSSKDTVYTTYEKSMVEAAKNRVVNCVTNNENCELPEDEEEQKMFLDILIDEGYLENMKDPETKNFCEEIFSYVRVQGNDAGDYKYKACLYCGDYSTDDDACRELNPENDPDKPICGTVTGDSTRWTNQNRTVTIGCNDQSSGCLQSVFSKTFGKTTKNGIGTIVIRDKSGNTENCNVNAYVDKDPATCNITAEGNYVESTGWYSLKATAKINDVKDGDGESGLLTYGMGTSIKNRDYNKKDSLEVGKGITTVIGYTKDVAGNEGYCAKEIKVGTEIPKFNMFYGYQIYPDKEPYVLDGMSLSGTTLTTNSTTPKITISNLAKYQAVEKVKITLNNTVQTTTTATLKSGTLTKTATMQQGSKEIVFVLKGNEIKSYNNFEITLGELSGKSYNINKIEILTKNGSTWTNKDMTINVEPIDDGMRTTEVSFDNGLTWTNSFVKTIDGLTTNSVITKNGIGMQSNSTQFTTKIDKVMPTINAVAKRKSNSAVVNSGNFSNEGLNFEFYKATVGESGAHIYYCQDTNNTCEPNIEAADGVSVTNYNNTTTDYYIRYKIVSNAESAGDVNVYNAKFDLAKPSCTFGTLPTVYVSKTTNIELTCTDNLSGLTNPNLSASNFTINNSNLSITTVTKSVETNATKYTITVKGLNHGKAKITLNNSIIGDKAGNVNDSVTTSDIQVNGVFKVTLDNQSATNAGTTTIYELYTVGWYSDSAVSNAISSITAPTRAGYSFEGYFTSKNGGGSKIINSNGTFTSGSSSSFLNDVTLYAYWVDKKNPTCEVKKSNTGTTTGVTTTVTCKDDGSGCDTSRSDKGETKKTAGTYTYTVYDLAGNKGTCDITVTSQVQKRTKTCSAGKSCKEAGCSKYNSCQNKSCGCQTYNSCQDKSCGCAERNSCADQSCGVKSYKSCVNDNCTCAKYKSCVNNNCSCAEYKKCEHKDCGYYKTRLHCKDMADKGTTGTFYTKDYYYDDMTCAQLYKKCSKASALSCCFYANPKIRYVGGAGCIDNDKTKVKKCATAACGCKTHNSCEDSSCGCQTRNSCADPSCGVAEYKSCVNNNCTCKTYKSCENTNCTCKTYKSCENSNCTCKTYNTNTSKCGCSTWGSFGSWANASSCTAGESSDHGTTTECQTLYN